MVPRLERSVLYRSRDRVPSCINEHLFLIRGNARKITQEYLYYTLLSQPSKNQIAAQISGSAQPGLKRDFLRGVFAYIPDALSEQTKIAEILSTVDRAIEQTEALIAKQQRIKVGLMQDLLTRGIDEHGNLRSEQNPPIQGLAARAHSGGLGGEGIKRLGGRINHLRNCSGWPKYWRRNPIHSDRRYGW